MTNSYKKESGSRHKKLLVPLVALLLCAAAMVGVGYAALMSDVTNTGNTIDSDGLTLNITDGVSEASGILDATVSYQSTTVSNTSGSTRAFHVDGINNSQWDGVSAASMINFDTIKQADLIINSAKADSLKIVATITPDVTLPAGVALTIGLAKTTSPETNLTAAELASYAVIEEENNLIINVIVTIGPTFNPVGNISVGFSVKVTAESA